MKREELNHEVQLLHSRIATVSLVPDDTLAFWRNYDAHDTQDNLVTWAFENRWFGNKTMNRVKVLIAAFRQRYLRFPKSFAVLNAWRHAEPAERRLLMHWHLQLTDPLYRRFSAGYLPALRTRGTDKVEREGIIRWLTDQVGSRWSLSTKLKFGQNLLTSASAAGIIRDVGINRRFAVSPPVSDHCLNYLFYLLRECTFEGTLLKNPYLASLGLSGDMGERRLHRLSGLSINRNAEVVNINWRYTDLVEWATNELGVSVQWEPPQPQIRSERRRGK